MAALASKLCGGKISSISEHLKKIKPVNGRLELIRTLPNEAKIFIDYAHTPDALENVMTALVKQFNKKITLVFGCGGERDKSKRKLMARVANNFCDKIIVTDDNPRNEIPSKIRNEIFKYISSKNKFNIGRRNKAIEYSLVHSSYEEIILIAGKGHESIQDYGKKKYFTSDKKIIKNIKIKLYNRESQNIKNENSKLINSIVKNKKTPFHGVKIDSRNCKKQNFYLLQLRANTKMVMILLRMQKKWSFLFYRIKKYKIKNYIKVKNSFTFLNKLAILKRKILSAKIIAITGSAGKTSLKTILGKILSDYGNTYYSPKSYNNHYGVPLSLCNLEINHKYGVFEIGMNKPGEIEKLSKIVKPKISVITNIAEAHIENFKNLFGIAKEKSQIISNTEKNGTVILNRDDKFFSFFK